MNGCKVKDSDEKLKAHEKECEHREVQCPKCRGEGRMIQTRADSQMFFFNFFAGLLPFEHIRQHLVDRHPDIPPSRTPDPGDTDDDVSTVCLESWLFGRAALTLPGIPAILSMVDFRGATFCPSILKSGGHWYIWIHALAGRRAAARFRAELSIAQNGVALAGPCPVYPVDLAVDEVLGRGETLEVSNRLVGMVVDRDGVTGTERRAGYEGRFSVRFSIREEEVDVDF